MTERRQAVIPLTRQTVEALLELPPGLRIVGVHDDWTNMGVKVLIQGEQLAPVDEATNPPVLHGGVFERRSCGHLHWSLPETTA